MLKIGDEIKVLPNVTKAGYFEIWNRIGVIKAIRQYKDEDTFYYVEIPNKINNNQISGWWILYEKNFKLIEEEKQIMETRDSVLDLYYERKLAKIHEKYNTQKEEIKNKDSDYCFLKRMAESRNQLSPNLQECIKIDFAPFIFSRDFSKEMNEIMDNEQKEINELKELCREVNIMLSECTTYEERQNTYYTYDILNEEGKINS